MTDGALLTAPRWILIVDDDDDIREVLMTILAMLGFVTAGARDGLEAIERIRSRGRPGLVLLDLRMPRLNGPDFVRWVRSDEALASMPIVILSGDATGPEQASTLAVAGCLRKPVDLDELLLVVGRQLA